VVNQSTEIVYSVKCIQSNKSESFWGVSCVCVCVCVCRAGGGGGEVGLLPNKSFWCMGVLLREHKLIEESSKPFKVFHLKGQCHGDFPRVSSKLR